MDRGCTDIWDPWNTNLSMITLVETQTLALSSIVNVEPVDSDFGKKGATRSGEHLARFVYLLHDRISPSI